MKKASRLFLAATAVLGSVAWANVQTPVQEPTKPATALQTVDIVDTAAKSDDLKIFSTLVEKAGLKATLKEKGPYTVFAPTDDAFKKLPEGLLDKLQANPEALKKVLTYHVLPESVASTDLKTDTETKSVLGDPIKVKVAEKTDPATNATTKEVTLNGDSAKVVKADIKASNGVIHTIDSVLVPPSLLKSGS